MQLRREIEIDLSEQIYQYQMAAIDASNIIDLLRQKEISYKKIIEELTPSWFDKYKFWLGAVLGFILGRL